MGVKLLYNPGDRKFRSVGEMLEWEPCPSRGWAPRSPVEQPRRTGKKCCYGQKSGGQYVAVLFSLQLTSYTVKPFVTLSNFRIKWEVYIFLKNCIRSSLLCWICFCMHLSMLPKEVQKKRESKCLIFSDNFHSEDKYYTLLELETWLSFCSMSRNKNHISMSKD